MNIEEEVAQLRKDVDEIKARRENMLSLADDMQSVNHEIRVQIDLMEQMINDLRKEIW